MEQSMTEKKHGGFVEAVLTIVYAVLIALVVRTFAYEPFNIPSGSMYPTLLVGDYLFVSKFSYGYSRYSLPFSLHLFNDRVLDDEPERGDVVVFKLPTDNKTDYIKRLVGLPGDRIQVLGGVLHINGEPVKREKVGVLDVEIPNPQSRRSTIRRFTEYIETLPTGRSHRIFETSDHEPLDSTEVYRVPEGHYFAMGDNRDHSQDSRVLGRVGYVPFENLIGRAEFLFFSTDLSARFWEIWNWPGAIRYGRLGDAIE